MSQPALLRANADAAAGGLPPLLARARQLAATVYLGEHGRRRAGMGAEFWQYRAALPDDPARAIDWRRSARSDARFVREHEWQAAQAVMLWVDPGRSLRFASARGLPEKRERADLLALASAVLLARAGERIGLVPGSDAPGLPPRTGEAQLARLAHLLSEAGGGSIVEHATPDLAALPARAHAIVLSDFLGPGAASSGALPGDLAGALVRAADRGIGGALVMVLDSQEEAFPFGGRTVFESVGGELRHETQEARSLRTRYLERLAARKAALGDLARRAGWHFTVHHTDRPASEALLWLHGAIGGRF